MADGGYIASPAQDPSKEKLWVETQKRLDRFLPHLFKEIFPPEPEQPQETPAVESSPEPRKTEEADQETATSGNDDDGNKNNNDNNNEKDTGNGTGAAAPCGEEEVD